MYLDELLVLKTSDWSDHLTKLEQVCIQTTGNALKLNIEKSFFGQSEMKYLGFWVTREGVSVTCYSTNLPRKPFNTPVSCPAHTRHSRYVTCVTRQLGMTLF